MHEETADEIPQIVDLCVYTGFLCALIWPL